jgi:hypothetical protein
MTSLPSARRRLQASLLAGSGGAEGQALSKKKRRSSTAGSAAAPASSAAAAAQLLDQLERLSKGKGLKSKAWRAAVEEACERAGTLSGQLLDAQPGGKASNVGKKRGRSKGGASLKGGDAAAAGIWDVLLAVSRRLQLQYLPLPRAEMLGAAVAGAALMSLLAELEGALAGETVQVRPCTALILWRSLPQHPQQVTRSASPAGG